MPWHIVLFLTFAALVVLALGSLLSIAIFDAVRRAYRKRPTRFRRVARSDSLDRAELPSVAERIGLQPVDVVPFPLQAAVREALGKGSVSDLMLRDADGGTLGLCNVRQVFHRSTRRHGDNTSTNYTQVYEFTSLVFHAAPEVRFPPFNLQPNPGSLVVKLFNRRLFGRPRFEEDPQFHEQVLVGTTQPDAVAEMLSPAARDVLKANADLTTSVSERAIVVYDRGNAGRGFRTVREGDEFVDCEMIAAGDWPAFYEAAVSVVEALRTARAESG